MVPALPGFGQYLRPLIVSMMLACLVQQTAQARSAAEIDAIVFDEMNRQSIVGMSLGIVRNNRLYYAMGYGYADPARKIPVTTRTIFRWSSVSKILTATAILQLAEQNPDYSLQDRVTKYVDYWPRTGNKANIRINHLLSNRSGIVHYNNTEDCYLNPSPGYQREKHASRTYNARQAVEVFINQDLCFDPGTSFKYSTFGYSLLGSAIEGATGTSYADWINRNFKYPLAMKSFRQGIGTQGGFDMNHGRLEYLPQDNGAWRLPGGGWESNIIDLARFANALIQGRLLNNTARLATQVPGNDIYGYGIMHKHNVSYAWHEGNNLNSSALMYLYPRSRERLGIVIMTNSRHGETVDIAQRLAQFLLD